MAEVYHFTQPTAPTPKKVFQPADESSLSGFQAVAWNTGINGIIVKKNHVEAIVNKTKSVEHATVQFQNWWGENGSIKAWDGTKYGYNVDKVKASFGGKISIPENSGSATGYATFYLRGFQKKPYIRYWLQFSLFDERGKLEPVFRLDPYTKELSMECQLGKTQYGSINPDSFALSTSVFQDLRFFGGSVSRQQLWNIMTEFKKLKSDILLEPNQHFIYAFGVTPELGDIDKSKPQEGKIKLVAENVFLRTEY